MEEYLRLAKIKSQQLDLNVKSNLAHSLGTLPSKGCIEVEEKGRMKVLKVIGDGNCQFRSVALLLTGIDDDENHKVLRKNLPKICVYRIRINIYLVVKYTYNDTTN